MRRLATTLALAILVVGHGSSALARPPSVGAELSAVTATVGDRLTLKITVERDADTDVSTPDVAKLISPLEVLSAAPGPPVTNDGRVVEEEYYVLASFETGSLGLPQLPYAYRTAEGESGVVWTDSMTVVIESVIPDTLSEEQTGPRDIKPPVELPRRVWPYVLAALLAVAAAVGLYYLRRWWAGRGGEDEDEAPEEPAVPRRAAHLYALERLAELERDDPAGRGDITGFYVRVTEIVRLYIRDRFAVDAIDMTTAELRPAMAEARVAEDEVDWAASYLEHADLAKFAKYTPTAERAAADLDEARGFVERTRLSGDEGEEERT